MSTRVIQLTKSDTASYDDITYTARGNRYGPVAPLLRRLIAEGKIHIDDMVEIRRGDVPCFKPRRAMHWAARDTVDDARDGPMHQPAHIGAHVSVVAQTKDAARKPRGAFPPNRRATQAAALPPC